MGDLTDWLAVYAQFAIIGAVVVRELVRPAGRNLYAIVIGTTMLVLVQGQDWWMLDQAQHHGLTQHISQAVALDAIRLANFYSLLFTCAFVATYVLAVRTSSTVPQASAQRSEAEVPFANEFRRRYLLPAIWTLVAAILLVYNSGGLLDVVLHPGRNIAGQALLLILLSLGKLPLLTDIAERRRPSVLALATFALTLLLMVLNSRFLALFIVLQVGIIANYCLHELRRRVLLGGAAIGGFVLIVYGLFRDFVSYPTTGSRLDPAAFVHFYASRLGQGPVGWFYQFNDEGFAGLAGILTRELYGGGIRHDFGASTLTLFTQLIPHAIRVNPSLPFHRLAEFFDSLYPYQHGSIVRPGLELAYAHFGLPGILALGVLLGWLAIRLHRAMQDRSVDRVLVGLISVQVLLLLRGTFVDAIFFGLGDLSMLFVYRLLQTFSFSRPWHLPLVSDILKSPRRQ